MDSPGLKDLYIASGLGRHKGTLFGGARSFLLRAKLRTAFGGIVERPDQAFGVLVTYVLITTVPSGCMTKGSEITVA